MPKDNDDVDDEETGDDEDIDTEIPDDDDSNDDDTGDEDEDKSKKKKEDDAWKPPSEAEWRKAERARRRANKQGHDLRGRVKELEAKAGSKTEEGDQEDLEAKLEEARTAASTEAATVWKTRVVKQAAKTSFVSQGLKGSPDKLIRLLDLEDIEVDDEGEIDGLDEQVLEIKEEYPDLFPGPKSDDDGKEKDKKRKVADNVDKGNKKHVEEKMSSAAQVAAALMGGGR
jgi:hypothetical protein